MKTKKRPRPAPPHAATAEPRVVQQVREAVRELLAEGRTEEALEYFAAAMAAVVQDKDRLERMVLAMQRQAVGTRSERISPEQLALLTEELEQLKAESPKTALDAVEEAQLEQDIEREKQAEKERTGRRQRRQRSWNARGAERRVHRIEVMEAERVCACGREKRHIGDDVTRRLEYVPAHFVEHEYHRAKYACGRCKDGVSTAPAPASVIERSAADASLLAHVIVSKYADHTPLHRLRRIYERSGVDIPVSTLSGWVGAAAARLQPLGDRLAERVLGAHVVGTDATGLKVLDPTTPGNINRGTIWCYIGDRQDVLFRYAPTGEGARGPWAFLAGRSGYIQADAASTFDRLYNGQAASAIEVGCWAHARRRFVALSETDCRVADPLRLIRRIYRVEELADLRRLTPEERGELRRKRTKPALDTLRRWLIETAGKEPPASDLAKAAAYSLNHWTALMRFLEDGRLAPDNNLCEQQLRDIALGRKNFLFAGSHDAAQNAALLYSLTRTCARHGVPPLPYLTDVLRKLAGGWPAARLDELLPDRWQQLHAAEDSSSA
jgi:transposase